MDSEPKPLQNPGCIMDYLMTYIELLQLQITTSSMIDIANTGKLLVNIKDRPVTLTEAHLKLLRYKRKMLNI